VGEERTPGPLELMTKRRTEKIILAAVGKLRRSEWSLIEQDYLQRLQRYTSFHLIEVKDAVGRGYPDVVAVRKEGEELMKASATAQRRILLTEKGKEMSSKRLALFLRKQIETYDQIAFLIGGPLGFSAELVEAAHFTLSLSRLTFPHEMARVIFLEQLYRAFTILHGHQYHKA
jgi:23S rRNA (pseudouridine1915-N3)-methyltransferase